MHNTLTTSELTDFVAERPKIRTPQPEQLTWAEDNGKSNPIRSTFRD